MSAPGLVRSRIDSVDAVSDGGPQASQSRAAIALGAVHAFDMLTQLLLPVLLVRVLAPEEYGQYRLALLVAQTAATVLSLNAAMHLVYLVPRLNPVRPGVLLSNVLIYLAVAGLVAAAAVGPPLSLLSAVLGGGAERSAATAALCLLWMLSLPVDALALAARRPLLQARLMLVQSLVRVGIVGATALLLPAVDALVLALCAYSAVRLALALATAVRLPDFVPALPSLEAGRWQFAYAVGFGVGGSLFLFRQQAEVWIAAVAIDAVAVATLAIAAVAVPLLGLVRQAATQSAAAQVAEHIAAQRPGEALRLNADTNLGAGAAMLPLAGALFVVAPEAVAWIYTDAFSGASTPMRVYLVATAASVVETSTLVQALGYGSFVLVQGAALLVVGSVLATLAAVLIGVEAVPVGSLVAVWAGVAANLWWVARRTRTPLRGLQHWRALAGLVAIVVPAVAIGLLVKRALGDETGALTNAAWGAAAFGATYCAAVLLSPAWRQRYVAFFRRLGSGAPEGGSQQ